MSGLQKGQEGQCKRMRGMKSDRKRENEDEWDHKGSRKRIEG